jgi:hypothetical protein
MEQQGVSAEILAQFDFNDFKFQKENRPESRIAMIHRMDELLTKEQCLSIMEKEGCCKGGQRDKDCKAFAKEHKDKSLAEKLKLISGIQYMMSPVLNDDGSFTITMSGHQNGVHTGTTTCSCGAIKKLRQPFSGSPTYCGCCAGHFLYHYQNALSVKLRLKEIVSSPLNTSGEKPCSFTFEIVKTEKTPIEMVQILPDEKQK